jgi:hypothetical protein
MTDAELIADVSRRTGLSPADIRAVLSAVADIRREQAGTVSGGPPAAALHIPSDEEVAQLIAAASRHPLGLEFLLDGHLGAVAAIFGVHAFTVDAARERVKEHGAGVGGAAPLR